jgi:hypothetical protein
MAGPCAYLRLVAWRLNKISESDRHLNLQRRIWKLCS